MKSQINGTKFEKSVFTKGEYVTYEGKFIARFKWNRRDAGQFITFLVNNFSQEEYFELMKTESPLTILKMKGYVSPAEKRAAKVLEENRRIESLKSSSLIEC